MLPGASFATLEVVLERRVAPLRPPPRVPAPPAPAATEVRVDEDAGRVQDAAQSWPAETFELAEDCVDERPRVAPRADVLSRPLEHGASRGHGRLVRLAGEALVGEQAVDRGEIAQRCRHGQSGRRAFYAPQARAGARGAAPSAAAAPQRRPGAPPRGRACPPTTPAAIFATTEIEAADPEMTRGDDLGRGGHAREVAADRAHEADLRRRLELRPQPGRRRRPPQARGRARPRPRATARSTGSWASDMSGKRRPRARRPRPTKAATCPAG